MSTIRQDAFQRPFFILAWTELSIAGLLLCIRCFAAWKAARGVGVDVYLGVVTFTLGVASMIVFTISAANGIGLSMSLLSANEKSAALLYGWINQVVALVAIGLAKVDLVVFLEQVQGYQTSFRTAFLWFIGASNLIVDCIAAVLILVQCSPVHRLWDEYGPGGCPGRSRIQIFGFVQGPWSAVCDFALVLYPIFILSRVRAFTAATKIRLCVLMGFGVIAGACTIVKTVKLTLLTRLGDETVTLADVSFWNQTEAWLVFIVNCVPSTRVLFNMAARKREAFQPVRSQSG